MLLVGLALLIHFGRKQMEHSAFHTIPADLVAFDITKPPPPCGAWRDSMPKHRDPETYRLYSEARKIWRSKIEYQLTHDEAVRILNDVRLASERGDWGARSLMSHFYLYGLGRLESNRVLEAEPEKSIEIVRMAVNAGQAWGYYDLGVAYEYGYGGVPFDQKIAWAYFLKAAELGSPDAQLTLASAYGNSGRFDAEETMLRCAFKQGHGPAAYQLGTTAKVKRDFPSALALYQAGTRFGDRKCAAALAIFFDPKVWQRWTKEELAQLSGLELSPDLERNTRYFAIAHVLEINPDLKLGRLDLVLPLPPSKLPVWNGIQDAIEQESDAPPTY